jgi:TPR repeat protein
MRSAAHYFKLSADQGDADGQFCYGICLRYGKGVSSDMRTAAHYFQLSADQGNAVGQVRYGECLLFGKGVSIDMINAAHYFNRCSKDCERRNRPSVVNPTNPGKGAPDVPGAKISVRDSPSDLARLR